MTEAHRDLVTRLFPSLDAGSFVPVGSGWACDTYLVDDAWIVQLPRNDRAAERLRRQVRLLPELAREVSASVPVPELISEDPPAMAYRRLDGEPCDGIDGIWPERLGRFLYDLHAVPPEFVGLRGRSPEDARTSTPSSPTRSDRAPTETSPPTWTTTTCGGSLRASRTATSVPNTCW